MFSDITLNMYINAAHVSGRLLIFALFLFQSVEAEFDPNKHYIIHNIQAILMLVQWMPDIQSHDLQVQT